MNEDSITIRCPKCGARNRVPKDRWRERPKCGKCKEVLDLSRLYPDRPIDVTDSDFQTEVGAFPGPVLVDFTALWCGHCRRLEPVLDELAQAYAGKVKIARVDVDNAPHTASRHGIRGVPALFFYKRGAIVDKAVGALPKSEIERRLNGII